MAKKRSTSLGVDYYLMNGKKRSRRLGTTTKATFDYILLLAQEHETIQDVYDAVVYDPDAKAILKIYIDRGYGDKCARDCFKPDRRRVTKPWSMD